MVTVNDFQKAVGLLRKERQSFEQAPGYQDNYDFIPTGPSDAEQYMSDMNNWCFVHVTWYMPSKNANGQMVIPTTSMATGFDLFRPTIHCTLNHVVASNNGGNWDNAPYVILAKYNDVVALNGNPQEVSQYDTYFIPNPDTGLVLPKNVYLIRPSDEKSSELYTIGEHEATYKTGNFTDDEVEQILDLIRKGREHGEAVEHDLYESYDEYMGVENDEAKMSSLLGHDDRLIAIWRKTNNKKDFLKGLLATDRDRIIVRFLRNIVVELAMQKCGFKYVEAHMSCAWTEAVERVANKHGIVGTRSNQGHCWSVEGDLERRVDFLIFNLNEMFSKGSDADEIFAILENNFDDSNTYKSDELVHRMFRMVIWCIVNDKFLDLYPVFQEAFLVSVDSYGKASTPEKMSDYSMGLDITVRRSAIVIKNKFIQWVSYLKREKVYEKLRSKILDFLGDRNQELLMNVFKRDNHRLY